MIIISKTRNIIANNIVYWRLKKKWSQDDLADKLSSSTQYISDIENAKRNISSDFIDRLSKIFEIKPQEFLIDRPKITDRRVKK